MRLSAALFTLIPAAVLAALLVACEPGGAQLPWAARKLVILTRADAADDAVTEVSGTAGFERELVQRLAAELGLHAQFVTGTGAADVRARLRRGEATLAAAWLPPPDEPDFPISAPYYVNSDVLVAHESTLPPRHLGQIGTRTIHVVAGSRQERALRRPGAKGPALHVVTHTDLSEIDLLERVASRRFDFALVSDAELDIGINLYPELQRTLILGEREPVVWHFAPGADPDLVAHANAFLYRMEASGELERLKDRYFGHVARLTPQDTTRFIERMHAVLPDYQPLFLQAQIATGIDWRLLAALAYQESKWDPLATSPTGVRGMMMLTADTADTLKVSNRLDPAQSIRAGAQYLADLRDALPDDIAEPDRTWLALAGYNLGMGHLKAARYIAGTINADPNAWFSMKKVLPLLAQPQYYNRLKSGKGRGGEAVILVENIRVYADILYRHAPAAASPELPGQGARLTLR